MKRTACILLLFLLACTSGPNVKFPSGAVISVELATTPEERAQGLMYREELAENTGMLFIGSQEKTQSFWMKNTLVPLDIIFIDANGVVVDIKYSFEPCKVPRCPTYTSKAPAKDVLEVNAGFAKDLNIGDKLEIKTQ